MEDSFDVEVCEGCGRSEYDSGHCPLCCHSDFACGAEECEMCGFYDGCLSDALEVIERNTNE